MCEDGGAAGDSAAYQAFAAEKLTLLQERRLTWTYIVLILLVPLLSVSPLLLVCWCWRARRMCQPRGRRYAGPPASCSRVVPAPSSAPSSTTPTDGAADAASGEHWQQAAATLIESERAATSLRNRVSGSLAWVGWSLCVLGLTPTLAGRALGLELLHEGSFLGATWWGLATVTPM